MRNLQEQVKKAFCYQKLFWPFTVWINCSSDLKNFANSRPSASNFKSFSRSLEQFFLTVGQNDFGNKMPLLLLLLLSVLVLQYFVHFFLLKCVVIFCYIDIKHDFWHFAIFYRLCIRLQIFFIARFKEMHCIDVHIWNECFYLNP